MIAAAEGHKKIIDLLIDKKVNLNEESPTGYRPVHFAAMNGHLDILKVIKSLIS